MRALVQRVARADVTVEGQMVGETGPGLMILFCAMAGDTSDKVATLARKVVSLRIFRDDEGRMNRSLLDTGGGALIVSQFTLAADTSRGNRPGFSTAAPPDQGRAFYADFCAAVESQGVKVGRGEFGADMQVTLTNDGPVTIWLEV